jgi:chromosome segregation ATPase
VQAQPAELPTASLQELKQRAHQLVVSYSTLQQNQQQLIAERDSLQEQLELLTVDRDGLRAERDTLAIQLQQLQAQQEDLSQQCERAFEERESAARKALLAALRQLFPYSAYRDSRPDLASLKDQDLVDYFVSHGIHEGGNLTYSAMESELQHLRSSMEDANAKAELFNQKSSHTAAQLDLLKDLFTKMTVQP